MMKVLYAQPIKSEPVLNPRDLEEGIYRPLTGYIDISYNIDYPYFTDIGAAVWETAKKMDPSASLKLLKGGNLWEIGINIAGLRILLKSFQYKGFFTVAKNMIIMLQLDGDEEKITSFVRNLVSYLGRYPWEMDDWYKFINYTGRSVDEAIDAWTELVGVPSKPAPQPPRGLKAYVRAIRELRRRIKELKERDSKVKVDTLSGIVEKVRIYLDDGLLKDAYRKVEEVERALDRRKSLLSELEEIKGRTGIDPERVYTERAMDSSSVYDDLTLRIIEIKDELRSINRLLYGE
jgi:hypothetical protein